MRKRWLLLTAFTFLAVAACAQGATNWTEGKHYFLIRPAQPTSTPGKIEVVEVFSYGCPACNRFTPTADRLKASLPANAEMVLVPASFIPSEDWPMFQRAYYAARELGVADKAHNAMYDAVWKSGELAVVDPRTQKLKNPAPSIEDAAKFYARVAGIKAADFVATANNSFSVDKNMRQADVRIKALGVDSTPTIVVNGKYRLDVSSAGGYDQLIELVQWLVAKESGGK
jgi:protein dithiol oxidoreductase (disulfide-forming)